MLGGNIWLKSKPGEGSVFSFTISAKQAPDAVNRVSSVSRSEEYNPDIRKLKIIIAEDNQLSSALLVHILQKYSREIITVCNGIDVVQACREHPDADLVLMDIQMPLMDGYEATRMIRKFNNEVVIIAQSAYAFAHDHQLALEAGCTDFISKPVNKNHLLHLVNKHLS
jgi:CheY-like chemotaxis protein